MSVWVYQKNKNIKPESEAKEESGTKGEEGNKEEGAETSK